MDAEKFTSPPAPLQEERGEEQKQGFELAWAREVVEELVEKLRPACERIEVAGSIRRGKEWVKDAEIVCIPKSPSPPAPLPQGEGRNTEENRTGEELPVWALNEPDGIHRTTFWGVLDEMVAGGIIEKALYGESGVQRWGELYRGVMFKKLRCEIFVADAANWGFQWWLRTGPGEANKYVMTWLSWKNAAIRCQGGYVWASERGWTKNAKGAWEAADRVRVDVPDEGVMFALLGMAFEPPENRTEHMYRNRLRVVDVEKFTSPPAPLQEERGAVQGRLLAGDESRYGFLPHGHYLRWTFESCPPAPESDAPLSIRMFQRLQAEAAVAEYNHLVEECRAEVAVLDRPFNEVDNHTDTQVTQGQLRRRRVALTSKQHTLKRLELSLRAWEVRAEEVK